MSTKHPLLRETAQVDFDSVQPLPGSSKLYVQGSRPDIKVPMREIKLTPTPIDGGDGTTKLEPNTPLRVYDTSGAYTDPDAKIDIRKGLGAIRQQWILDRDDTVQLETQSSEYTRCREADLTLEDLRFDLKHQPRKAKPGKNVSQMHYAKQGIITPEMEYIAIRENMALQQAKEQGVLEDQVFLFFSKLSFVFVNYMPVGAIELYLTPSSR